MVGMCQRRKEFITISPTTVEVTGFNVLPDSQILSILELVDSNDHIYIVGICNIGVVNQCILDNVRGRRLA